MAQAIPDVGNDKAVAGWRSLVTARRLRSMSGLVLFTFVTMHLLNHALLLISVERADAAREYLAAPWRTVPGTVLLYGAVLLHLALTLQTLYRRQTLVMRPIEFLRLVLGLLIPYFIIDHVVGQRLGIALYDHLSSYGDVVRALWITSPAVGVQQSIALIAVWTHGCIGVSFLVRHRESWRPWIPFLLAGAVLLPTLALLGFAMMGRWMAIEASLPGAGLSLFAYEPERVAHLSMATSAARSARLEMIASGIKTGYIALIAAILVLRVLRLFHARTQSVAISYGNGRTVRVLPGTSLLEASRANGIPHYGICGGNARCSTCRVRITASSGEQPSRTPAERATLDRIQAGPDIRLACQLRPTHDLSVELVLQPSRPQDAPIRDDGLEPPREREIAVLFCDLRGFTRFSETRLPYDVVFLLNRYFVIIGEAVTNAGGRVDKFLGDGAMAVFGFESPPGEACRAALIAADAILESGARLNKELKAELGVTFNIAIGIHFGPAVVGVMGYGAALAETAIGDTVNVASRLESIAKEQNHPLAVSGRLLAVAGIGDVARQVHPMHIRGRDQEIEASLLTAPRLAELVGTFASGDQILSGATST